MGLYEQLLSAKYDPEIKYLNDLVALKRHSSSFLFDVHIASQIVGFVCCTGSYLVLGQRMRDLPVRMTISNPNERVGCRVCCFSFAIVAVNCRRVGTVLCFALSIAFAASPVAGER